MPRLLALSLLALPAVALAAPPVAGGLDNAPAAGHDDAIAIDRGDTERADARIINGFDATIEDYPETGMLILDGTINLGGAQDVRTAVCSSTLIAPDVVLLAAHCLDEDAFTFGFGTLENETWYWSRQADLSSLDGSNPNAALPEDAIIARDIAVHEGFDLNTLQTGLAENDDIALLFLDEPVFDVEPGVLPTPEEVAQIVEAATVTVVGWGQQTATEPFTQPPAGTIYIKQQGDSFISLLGDTEMKIGEVQTDVRKCHGDSGGPSFLELEDQNQLVTRRVIGVTSHAYDQTDCNETGGVDTRVDAYFDWIEDQMRSRCEDGTRAWCEDEESFGILPPPSEAGGCSCSTAPNPLSFSGLGLGLLALAGLRRRR